MIGLKLILLSFLLLTAPLFVSPAFSQAKFAPVPGAATCMVIANVDTTTDTKPDDSSGSMEEVKERRQPKPMQPDLYPMFPHLLWIALIVIPIVILLVMAKNKKDPSDS